MMPDSLSDVVTREVMGWHKDASTAHPRLFNWIDDDGSIQSACETWIPDVSLTDAMRVVENMRSKGWHVSFSDYDDRAASTWFVEFLKSDATRLHIGDGSSDLLAEAICRAALSAVRGISR